MIGPLAVPPEDDHAVVARIERMLDLAPHLGLDPEALAFLGHRLVALERQREGMPPSPRRDELDRLIAGDLTMLCQAYKKMGRVLDRMPSA